jgi:hypothetical protein
MITSRGYLMTNKQNELFRGKVLEGSLAKPFDRNKELKSIQQSSARWWFECLLLSDDYKACCEAFGFSATKEIEETYNKFGDVFSYLNFTEWWIKVARKKFEEIEKKEVSFIREVDAFRRMRFDSNKLIIEVPLNLRQETVKRKIGSELKKIYEELYKNEPLDIYKESSAQIKFQKSKMQSRTVKLLVRLCKIRKENPSFSLAKLGKEAGIEIDMFRRSSPNDEQLSDKAYEDRRLTIAVGRYLGQAKKLIDDAARGKFPFLKNKSTRRIRTYKA